MRRAVLVLTALAMAAAFPMTLPSREHSASAEVAMTKVPTVMADTAAAATIPSPTFTSGAEGEESDAAQTAAMMLVGTLLIGIGSVVRRVV